MKVRFLPQVFRLHCSWLYALTASLFSALNGMKNMYDMITEGKQVFYSLSGLCLSQFSVNKFLPFRVRSIIGAIPEIAKESLRTDTPGSRRGRLSNASKIPSLRNAVLFLLKYSSISTTFCFLRISHRSLSNISWCQFKYFWETLQKELWWICDSHSSESERVSNCENSLLSDFMIFFPLMYFWSLDSKQFSISYLSTICSFREKMSTMSVWSAFLSFRTRNEMVSDASTTEALIISIDEQCTPLYNPELVPVIEETQANPHLMQKAGYLFIRRWKQFCFTSSLTNFTFFCFFWVLLIFSTFWKVALLILYSAISGGLCALFQ